MEASVWSDLSLEDVNHGVFSGTQTFTTSRSKTLVSISPIDEARLGSVYLGDEKNYELLVQKACDAVATWRDTPAPKRGEIVRLIGDALRKKKSALAKLITLEMGKSYTEALGEVQEMIDMADFAVGQSRMLYGKTMHSERPLHRMYEQWHPYGVVGVITAFNFPVAVWAWNAFIAAICGNVVIWKPSHKTPLCAIAVHHICQSVMASHQTGPVFSLFIPESRILSERLVDDKRIPLISFTGSTAVGRELNQRVAKRLGRCLLELGGNNAVIVDDTADLDLSLLAVVFGAIGTAGQRCTTTRRLLVHESIFKKMLSRLVRAYQSIRIGSPLNHHSHMGPLIDQQAVNQYRETILAIRSEKGQIECGGNVLATPGFFVEPTIVTNLPPTSLLLQNENFLPILFVLPFHTFEEAIEIQNSVPQGLSSALFTQNLSRAEHFLSAKGSDCGIANINIGTSGAEIGGAFGGEKDTGGGREAGSDAWKAYMRRQTNTINWGHTLPLAQGIQFDLGE